MISFDEYYRSYLGCPDSASGSSIIAASRRSLPVALFYQHHYIATVLDGRLVHSVAPGLFREFDGCPVCKEFDSVDGELARAIDDLMFNVLPPLSYSVMLMQMITLESADSLPQEDRFPVSVLSEESRYLFEKQFSQRGSKFAEFYWNARIESILDGRYFAIIENDEITSSSFISDIDSGGGNIVVSTRSQYRNRGYGKAVVAQAVRWCFENGVRPIYLVDKVNTPSVRVAEGLGLQKVSEEVVVSTYTGISV